MDRVECKGWSWKQWWQLFKSWGYQRATSYLALKCLGKRACNGQAQGCTAAGKIMINQSEQDRPECNERSLFEAYAAYWQWARTYSLYSLYTKYLQASAERYRLVKIAYENGDRAAMDTLEALTQVQSFYDAAVRCENEAEWCCDRSFWIICGRITIAYTTCRPRSFPTPAIGNGTTSAATWSMEGSNYSVVSRKSAIVLREGAAITSRPN